MGELVEDRGSELVTAVAHHRAHDRVGKLAQGRIRGYPLDHDVIAALFQSCREVPGALFLEVTPIGHTTGDRLAPWHRLHRESRGSNDVPHDERTVDLDVGAIAV